MLLRILASACVFLLVVAAVAVSAATGFDGFTLYNTRFGWTGNAASIGGVVVALLASIMISVGYFRRYSSVELGYQPYANVVVVLLAALVISQTELGGEAVPPQVIEITVLPGTFMVEGRTGTDVVATLADVMPPSDSDGRQLMLSASSEVGYERLQDALHSLRNAGYRNVGLSSDMHDAH